MKKINLYAIIGIVALTFTISCNSSKVIFQENTNDWEVHGAANWNFSNKELVGEITDGLGFVMTKDTYNDFVLELEFKPDSTINSGIFIRCKKAEINPTDCYELNIWDLHPNQDFRTGALVTKTVPLAFVETITKWNAYKIKAEKNHLQVWVNGELTADTKDDGLTEGYVGLQAMGTGTISFRNVKIKRLKRD